MPDDAPARPPTPTEMHGAISRLTPTALSAWSWCPRRYYLKYVLGLPESDGGASTDFGKLAHEILAYLHRHGGCHDEASAREVLVAHDCDSDAMRALLDQHRTRCPRTVDDARHDIARARYHHLPPPYFLATAELDSVWVHDGLFDIRDYKTGGAAPLELRDDVRARIQAWVWAPLAERKGLRLRVRYEYLSAGVTEPDPWEPDGDDLDAVEAWLTGIVTDMRSSAFEGVADAHHCGACGFRSICSDSAAPSEPAWPVLGASIAEASL